MPLSANGLSDMFRPREVTLLREAAPREGDPMSDTTEALFEKLKTLPPQRLAEVADFVDFLKDREEKARVQKVDELFTMVDRLTAVEPRLTPEEIQAEIAAARAERRARSHADRR